MEGVDGRGKRCKKGVREKAEGPKAVNKIKRKEQDIPKRE